MKKIVIAGGSGLIGKSLSAYLKGHGHDVSWLSRRIDHKTIKSYHWDPSRQTIDSEALQDVDVLIQLAGTSIGDWFWTQKKKREILNSRLDAVHTIHTHLREHNRRIPLIIQASAIGFYGDRGDEILDESSNAAHHGFLPDVCKQWESDAQQLKSHCDRFCILRTGLYLNKNGGIWPKMSMSSPMRILTVFGNGRQYYSWIHSHDYNRACEFIIDSNVTGIFNMTAPQAVRNSDFINTLNAASNKKHLILNVPGFLLKLVLGELSSLVLDSALVQPARLQAAGFKFQFAELHPALIDLLKPEEVLVKNQ